MGFRSSAMLEIFVAVCVILISSLIYAGALSWFGRLPGDIRWGNERTQVLIPITSMLLVSLGLSLVMYLLRRFF